MTDDNIGTAVEAELIELSGLLTEPGERECLRCYLLRMIYEFGCDGRHRWTVRWRNSRAPKSRGLLRRLQQLGGCCCDCEVLLNVFPDYPQTDRPLPCAGQPLAGSASPCDLRQRRRSA
jgi:Protein of unknown function (DUF2695)